MKMDKEAMRWSQRLEKTHGWWSFTNKLEQVSTSSAVLELLYVFSEIHLYTVSSLIVSKRCRKRIDINWPDRAVAPVATFIYNALCKHFLCRSHRMYHYNCVEMWSMLCYMLFCERRVDRVTRASKSGTVSDLRLEVQGAIPAQVISLKPVLEPGKMQEVVSVKA